MFQLFVQDIYFGQQVGNKEEVIWQVVVVLVSVGNVVDGYVNGMLVCEQQILIFFGNGIVILYGMMDMCDQVLKIGVQVFQFLQGVIWGEGQIVYVVIGIVVSLDEYFGLLCQLIYVLSDDVVVVQLQFVIIVEELCVLLMGEKQSEVLKLDNEIFSFDVVVSDLLILQVLNVVCLKEVGVVDVVFVSYVINDMLLNFGQGVWLNDSVEGNLCSVVVVSCVVNVFICDEQLVFLLVMVVMVDEQLIVVLNCLSKLLLDKKVEYLLKVDVVIVLVLLISDDVIVEDVLSVEFVVCNEYGLYVCLGIMLVNIIK